MDNLYLTGTTVFFPSSHIWSLYTEPDEAPSAHYLAFAQMRFSSIIKPASLCPFPI